MSTYPPMIANKKDKDIKETEQTTELDDSVYNIKRERVIPTQYQKFMDPTVASDEVTTPTPISPQRKRKISILKDR